jgi:hypothetical protein
LPLIRGNRPSWRPSGIGEVSGLVDDEPFVIVDATISGAFQGVDDILALRMIGMGPDGRFSIDVDMKFHIASARQNLDMRHGFGNHRRPPDPLGMHENAWRTESLNLIDGL